MLICKGYVGINFVAYNSNVATLAESSDCLDGGLGECLACGIGWAVDEHDARITARRDSRVISRLQRRCYNYSCPGEIP